MDTPDIKIGETYNVRAKVVGIGQNGNPLVSVLNHDIYCFRNELPPITPSEPPTSVGTAPKYDPCRKFKKGDIVEIDNHGRNIAESMKKEGLEPGKRYTVTEDESNTGHDIGVVSYISDDEIEHHSMFFWLKLVTPAEELEPYVICENDASYEVRLHSKKENHTMAIYNKNAYGDWLKARYAAEAERDRLNAEHRKENS